MALARRRTGVGRGNMQRYCAKICPFRTLFNTESEVPVTDRQNPVPKTCRDVFLTLLSAVGGLLATNASVGDALYHYLKSWIHVKWP